MFTGSAQYECAILENMWDDRRVEDVVLDWNIGCQRWIEVYWWNSGRIKVVRTPRSTGNVAAEWKLERERR